MTPEQEKQFNDYGCGSRCLLEWKRRKGEITTPDEYIAKFINDYPFWNKQLGATSTSILCEIIKKLGIASNVQVFIDPNRIREESKHPNFVGLLGFTERLPKQQMGYDLQISCHCMLIEPIKDISFGYWSPLQNGGFEENLNCGWDRWLYWMMHGLVLYK